MFWDKKKKELTRKSNAIYNFAVEVFREEADNQKITGVVDLPFFIKAMNYTKELKKKGLIESKYKQIFG